MLKEFATKRHVKLSRVMVKAKDEVVAPTKPAKPRRRRSSSSRGGGGVGAARAESDRSLAKVRPCLHIIHSHIYARCHSTHRFPEIFGWVAVESSTDRSPTNIIFPLTELPVPVVVIVVQTSS